MDIDPKITKIAMMIVTSLFLAFIWMYMVA